MNNDSNQSLEAVGNDAFEARLVAWVLGEASAFERAELDALYRDDREVALYVDRLRLLDGLIKEEGEDVWRLSDDKRAAVLALMDDEPPVVARRSRGQWWSVAAAAVVMLVAIGGALAPMGMKRVAPMMKESQVITSYSASASPSSPPARDRQFFYLSEYEPPEDSNREEARPGGALSPAGESRLAAVKSSRLSNEAVARPLVAVPVSPAKPTSADSDALPLGGAAVGGEGGGFDAKGAVASNGSENIEDRLSIAGNVVSGGGVIRREIPAAPSSSMAKVIGSNGVSPQAIPVPEVTVPDAALDFGDGDDFGDGWGGADIANTSQSVDGVVPTLDGVPAVGGSFWSEGEVDEVVEEESIDPLAAADSPNEASPANWSDPFASPESQRSGAGSGEAFGFAGEAQGSGAGDSDENGRLGRQNAKKEIVTEEVRYKIDGGADRALGLGKDASALESEVVSSGFVADGSQGDVRSDSESLNRGESDSLERSSGSGGGLAERGKLKRQSEVAESDRYLLKARNHYANGEHEEARQLYENGLESLPESPVTDERRKFLNDSLADAEVAVAEEFRRVGRYDEAKIHLEKAVERASDSNLAEQKLGELTDPIRTSPALTDDHNEMVEEVRQGLYMGQGHYDLGQFDKAKEQYEEVLRNDPSNTAARRGMERVAATQSSYYRAAYDETRAELLSEVDSAWEMKADSSKDAATQTELEGRGVTGAGSMRYALEGIVIPQIDFDDVTLEEAVDFLQSSAVEQDVRQLDPKKKGLGMRVEFPSRSDHGDALDAVGVQDASGVRVSGLKLKDVPLGEALNYVAESTRTRWGVEDGGIVFKPATEVGEDLVTRTFEVPADFVSRLSGQQMIEREIDPFAPPEESQAMELKERSSIVDMLKDNGVRFAPESSAQFFAGTSTLLVRNTPTNLDLIEQLTQSIAAESIADSPLVRMEEISASEEPFSTFSLHVSDSSFKLAAAAMERGEIPEAEGIRPEEFYNAFDYGDPAPAASEPVACVVEQSAHPAFPQRNLMRVAVRTGSAGRAQATPLNLTLLLDNSGSMERADRAAGVGQAVEQLSSLLQPGDKVTVAGFSRQPRLLVDRLDGAKAEQLNDLVNQLPSEGGTNLEEALVLGEELAKRQFVDGAQNRVVLFTDGAANLGDADPENLNGRIDTLRQNGIAFDAAGFGADGLNDRLLERLTRNGNGRYYVVDDPEEAGEGFADKLAGAFRPQAENVKVQVVFNPARVGNYKLIGFEKHRLKKEDFRNDSVDAAEMASEEAGVALYQFEVLPEGEGEIGEVSVRFRDVASGQMVERTWPIPYDSAAPAFDQAAESLQLAGLAALAAEKLRAAPMSEMVDFAELGPVLGRVSARYPDAPKIGQLKRMIEQLR